jgi:hypothetical protein
MKKRNFERDSDDPNKLDPVYYEVTGWALEGVVGLDLPMGGGVYLDLAGRVADFAPEPALLDTEDITETISDGWSLGLHLGLTWFPAPKAPTAVGDYGSLGLAYGEMLLGNFIPWLGAEYPTKWKDITRISPTTWRQNLSSVPVWDDNHFHINMLLHPYQGNYYFNAGRSNGFGYEKSYLFTLLGSALWECCGESHKPSASDLVTTTLGGAALGEVLYRVGTQMLLKNRWYYDFVTFFLTPSRIVTHAAMGKPAPPPNNPAVWETPSVPAPAMLAAGWSSFDGPFFRFGTTYEDMRQVGRGSRPFSHFDVLFEITPWGKHPIGRAQIQGNLWSFPAYQTPNLHFAVSGFQGLDYINNDAFEFGGETLGLTAGLALGQAGGHQGSLSVNVHSFFGGVQSEFAEYGQQHTPRGEERERDREYDFTGGLGYGANFLWKPLMKLRVGGFYRWDRHWVLDGSNLDGHSANHATRLMGASVVLPRLWRNLGLGFDGTLFRRTSEFTHPDFASVTHSSDSVLRLYLSYSSNNQPLSLFVF